MPRQYDEREIRRMSNKRETNDFYSFSLVKRVSACRPRYYSRVYWPHLCALVPRRSPTMILSDRILGASVWCGFTRHSLELCRWLPFRLLSAISLRAYAFGHDIIASLMATFQADTTIDCRPIHASKHEHWADIELYTAMVDTNKRLLDDIKAYRSTAGDEILSASWAGSMSLFWKTKNIRASLRPRGI